MHLPTSILPLTTKVFNSTFALSSPIEPQAHSSHSDELGPHSIHYPGNSHVAEDDCRRSASMQFPSIFPPIITTTTSTFLIHSRGNKHFEKMATTIATASTIVGLGSSTHLSSTKRPASLSSGFLKSSVTVRNPLSQPAGASGGKFTCFQRDWLRRDLNVIGFGLIGWLAPSSIPVIDGKSLTGLFFESIGTELAHFPTPPALTSQFWLWLITWHLGLFITLTFGQIGFKGRTEDYF